MLDIEKVTVISGEMRAVVESEWPELAHKLPPTRACARHGVLVVGEEMKGLVNCSAGRTAEPLSRAYWSQNSGRSAKRLACRARVLLALGVAPAPRRAFTSQGGLSTTTCPTCSQSAKHW
jgi:hypothetical protein